MRQQLKHSLLEYLRTYALVNSTAQRSYRQLVTDVAGQHRAAKKVMAKASRDSLGTPARRGQTSSGSLGLTATFLATPGGISVWTPR